MASSFAIADLGSGRQISSVTTDAGTISLASAPVLTLRLWAVSGGGIGAEEATTSWSSALTGSGADQTITWTHAGTGTTASIRVQALTGPDRVTVTPAATLAGSWASTYALHSIEFSHRVAPWHASSCRLWEPTWSGQVYPDATASSIDARSFYPQLPIGDRDGIDTVAAGAFAYQQFLTLWHDASTLGYVVLAADNESRGKDLRVRGTGSAATITVRCYLSDDRTRTSATVPYAIELAPITRSTADAHGWYDAAIRYRDRMEAIGAPAFDADPIKERTDLPSALESATIIGFAQSFVEAITNDDAVALQRADEYMELLGDGAAERVILSDYRWSDLAAIETGALPEGPPVRSGAAARIGQWLDRFPWVTLYTINPLGSPSSPNWASVWSDGMTRTAAGAPYTASGMAASVTFTAGYARASDTAHWQAIAEAWRDRLTTALPGTHGTYMDAQSAPYPIDYGPDVAADKRGLGAAQGTDMRAATAATVAAWRTLGADTIVHSEHQGESSIGVHDIVGYYWGFGLQTGFAAGRWVGVASTLYSDRQRWSSYWNLLSLGDAEVSAIGYAVGYALSLRWHEGQMLTIPMGAATTDLRPLASEIERADWDEINLPMIAMVRDMYVGLADHSIRFHTGRRLRPLASGHEADMIATGYIPEIFTAPVSGRLGIRPDRNLIPAKVHSSVWLDTATDAIGIFASSWDWVEPQTIAVDMDTTTHPDLPDAVWLRVVDVDATTGAEATLSHFRRTDGLHCTMSVDPRKVRHWRIESADDPQRGGNGGNWSPESLPGPAWSSASTYTSENWTPTSGVTIS